jgi:hypothetical protein
VDLAREAEGGFEPPFVVAQLLAPTSVRPLDVTHGPASICVPLGEHFAPAGAPDESAERYGIVEVSRQRGGHTTVLRVHLYDLGPERGWFVAGLERPT